MQNKVVVLKGVNANKVSKAKMIFDVKIFWLRKTTMGWEVSLAGSKYDVDLATYFILH